MFVARYMECIKRQPCRQWYTIIKKTFSVNANADQQGDTNPKTEYFDTVFSFPLIRSISIFNRLKVYQGLGTAIAIPGCGILEMSEILPNESVLIATIIGLSVTAILSVTSLIFKNTIGFLYINNNEDKIKIAYVDFWGNRRDRIVDVEEWIPLFDMPSRVMDGFYLSPQLTDGTRYKLFVKIGKVLDAKKMGRVIE